AGNFDAVWIHGWGRIGLVQAITAAHSLDLPILLRGESTPDVRLGTLRAHVRNWFLQWLLRLVSAFLCIGSLNRQFYRLRGISENKLFSVPYAVDNDWFRLKCESAAAKRSEFRRELELLPGRPIILFTGKFIPQKSPLDLVT